MQMPPQIVLRGVESAIELVDKPGAAEMHDQLHDLPGVSSRRK